MADDMKKVIRGQPLDIPATTFNTFVDSARDYQMRQRNQTPGRTQNTHAKDTILVKNNSGSDRDRFDVLGIDGVIFTPTDNADTFKNDVALKGITPDIDDHAGKFVILAEPLKSGSIGRAFISGVCVAYVDIDDEDHTTADVKDGDATSLLSSDDGAVSILWAESGTGDKWAVVRFGGGGGSKMFIAKVVSDAAGAGVYNCYIQKLDATNWGNASAVIINKNTDSVEVLNMAEDAVASHYLDAGNYILCWKMTDDEGNSRYVGYEILGRYYSGNGVW